MITERKKTPFEKFFSAYFSKFGHFTLLNIIFAVPLGLAFGICFLLCRFLLPQAAMLILPATLILAAPFYSGVVVVGKKLYYDEVMDSVFAEYIRAVKENFLHFLVHGVVAYLAFEGAYYGISIYTYLAQASRIFYAMLVVSIIVLLLLLFLLFGVSLMSAFFELKLKDVYKNSFLMTFGEIKSNFIAALCVVAFLAVLSIPLAFFFNLTSVWGEKTSLIVIYSYLGAIFAFLIPSAVSSFVTASLYPDLKRVITGEAKENIEAIRKEEAKEELENSEPDYSSIDLSALEKSDGEYVFYNGKMIKKSTVLKEIKEKEGKE